MISLIFNDLIDNIDAENFNKNWKRLSIFFLLYLFEIKIFRIGLMMVMVILANTKKL